MLGGPDPGSKQDRRAAVGTRAQDDPRRTDDRAVQEADTDGPDALEDDVGHLRVGSQGQVPRRSVDRQIAVGRGHAHPAA